MKTRTVASAFAASCLLCAASARAQLIPGDLTDSTAGTAAETQGAFQVPAALQYPYISTYYVRPVVSPDEEVCVKVFVTDWNNSRERFGDDSHAFGISLRYSADGRTWKTLEMKGVKSGDHVFKLGKLAEGRYDIAVSCVDEKGRPSHTVWQEFRSETARKPNTHDVTAVDLAKYGIVPEKNRYSHVGVAVTNNETFAKNEAFYTEPVKAAAAKVEAPANGYVIVHPEFEGKPGFQGWKRSTVVYGKDYDKAAVAAEAAANTQGFQKLLDEMVSQGVERLVLPKDAFFRVSHTNIVVPSNITLDLNGSTLKMNGFTGDKCNIVVMNGAHNAHVVNGTIEGDYYEHDYANSDKGSEWVCGIGMFGDCRYSSFENVTVKNIAGYGGGNGILDGNHVFPGMVWIGNSFEPGAIDRATGELVKDAPFQFTTRLHDISKMQQGWLAVSPYLGYQGIAGQSWYYTAVFYDADEKFISSEVAFQYRIVRIPEGAKFLRVTMVEESLEKMNELRVAGALFQLPVNCAFKNVRFERCRAVGLAQSAMRNMLVEDCEFTASGEVLAKCAYDAEDGWDMMQDVYIHRNRFFDSPMNELLTCAGHNFIIEDNDASIHTWGRTLSACIRNNRCKTGHFVCDTRLRTMHSRYENNVYSEKVAFGQRTRGNDDWTVAMSGSFDGGKSPAIVIGDTGVLRDATVRDLNLVTPRCVNVSFTNCTLQASYANASLTGCLMVDCKLNNLYRTNTFERCTFVRTPIVPVSQGSSTFVRCAFTNSPIFAGWWSQPASVAFKDCTVKMDNEFFLRVPVYSIDTYLFLNCAFDCGAKSPIDICDLRKNKFGMQFEPHPARLGLMNCTTVSSEVPLVNAPGHGEKPSEKPFSIHAKGNKAADGSPATTIPPDLVHTTWKVVEPAAETPVELVPGEAAAEE